MQTATRTSLRVHIRWMINRDRPEVCRIEDASFDYGWTDDDFLRCLRQRNCIGMVAEDHRDRVVGYMVYLLEKDHLSVLNMAVDPACRRQGIGRQMVDKLKTKLSGHRRTGLELVVVESNLPAQLFFRRMGFLAEDVIRGHCDQTGEDGYGFAYRIKSPVECGG